MKLGSGGSLFPREDARGVAVVASENLLHKLGSEIFSQKFLFTVCYTILKFLPSSLEMDKLKENCLNKKAVVKIKKIPHNLVKKYIEMYLI